MRKLLVLIVVLALGWAGYWFVGATAVERGLTGWLEDRRAAGWTAGYGDLGVSGFPNRFDTTLTDLHIDDPLTGFGWRGPFFQAFALSYRPNHVIAVFPPQQTILTPYEEIDLAAGDMRGSVVVSPGMTLALDRATFVAEDVEATGSLGWSASVEEARFAVREAVRENAYDIGLEMLGVTPDAALTEAVDPGDTLPAAIERVRLDATVVYSRPLDRFALQGVRPQPVAIEVNDARATWGDLAVTAEGELDVDPQGIPTGILTLEVRNWRQMLALAVEAGLVPERLAETAERGLALLAGLGGGDDLRVPLTFRDGTVSLGPVPLGPAPRLIPPVQRQ